MANFNTHGGPFGRYGAQWYKAGARKKAKNLTTPNTGDPGSILDPTDLTTQPDQSYKDSNYYGTDSQITQGLNNLKPYLINQGNSLAADYGISGTGFDPTTYDPANPQQFTIDWANVDTTNPYSRAALLKKSYQQTSRGDGNRMAAAGQLYSGAYQSAQNNDTSNYNQGQNTLQTNFARQYGDLYSQWQNAQTTASGQRLTNTGNSIAAHANDPAAPPVKVLTPAGQAKVKKALTNSRLYQQWRHRG